MAYAKTTWKDRAVQKPLTYTLQSNGDGTTTLIPAEGTIVEPGTAITASVMNKLETQYEQAVADIKASNLSLPNQSSISAFRNTTLALTSGVDTKIPSFNSVFRDTQAELNSATGEITIKDSGLYLLSGSITFTAALTALSSAKVYKNGTFLFTLGGGTGQQVVYFNKLGQFVAGDKLTFYAQQNSGAAATLSTALVETTKLS